MSMQSQDLPPNDRYVNDFIACLDSITRLAGLIFLDW